jgi:toxin HigB-1
MALAASVLSIDDIIAMRYYQPMIVSFHDEPTQSVWAGLFSRKLPNQIQIVARRKLRMLDAAQRLDDLRIPPANRLEALAGDRSEQHSIRINDQWRVCFVWKDGNAELVEICDYH